MYAGNTRKTLPRRGKNGTRSENVMKQSKLWRMIQINGKFQNLLDHINTTQPETKIKHDWETQGKPFPRRRPENAARVAFQLRVYVFPPEL